MKASDLEIGAAAQDEKAAKRERLRDAAGGMTEDVEILATCEKQIQQFIDTATPQAQQEPVAWMTPDGEGFRIRFSSPVNVVPLGWDALYLAPQPVQQSAERGEPVAWIDVFGNIYSDKEITSEMKSGLDPLYTSPPAQRKPLTDD